MQFLIVIKTAPAALEYHSYVCKTVAALINKGARVAGVFFTGEGAVICSGRHEVSAMAGRVRDSYLQLRNETGVPLFCCGRAFRNAGFMPEDLEPGFELSGNAELTELFADCDSTVTF